DWDDRPVTFPPGRAKLETRPSPIGSLVIAKTIGISEVTCFAATAEVPALTITLVLRRTNSAVNCLARSGCPSDQRYSILAVLPSTQPSVRSRFTKALPTGLETWVNTIGITLVSLLSSAKPVQPETTIASGVNRTNSAAK